MVVRSSRARSSLSEATKKNERGERAREREIRCAPLDLRRRRSRNRNLMDFMPSWLHKYSVPRPAPCELARGGRRL